MVRWGPLLGSGLLHTVAVGMALLLEGRPSPGGPPELPSCISDSGSGTLEVIPRPDPVDFLRELPFPAAPVSSDDFEPEFEVEREPPRLLEVDPAPRASEAPCPLRDLPLSPQWASVRLPPPASARGAVVEAVPSEICCPPPDYPDSARRRGLEGEALVEFIVLPDGTCGEVRLVECSGSPRFGEAAVSAVRKWRYRPAVRDGKAVEAVVRVRFVFRLRG